MKFNNLAFLIALTFAKVSLAQTPPAEPEGEPPATGTAPATEPPSTTAQPIDTPEPAPAAPAEPAAVAAPTAAPPAADATAAPPPPPPAGPRPAPGAWKIETPTSSVKIGALFQPQFEAAGHPLANSGSANFFLRRVRLLLGGTLFKNVEFFFDTDFANLFKADQTNGTKSTPGMNVQDALVTIKAVEDMVKLDAGYMLPPSTHNALQGAGTLYSWDYFQNSFTNSNSFNSSSSPVGRDAGVQVRGLLIDNHLEYRVGLFQGFRNIAEDGKVASRNFFRVAGRVQVNILDAETGFFYAGTYLGAKKVLSLGGTFDIQDDYKHFGGDAFVDLPVGPGVFTGQLNYAHYDGDDFLRTVVPGTAMTAPAYGGPNLVKQDAIMGEIGYLFDEVNLSPIFRLEHLSLNVPDPGTDIKELRIGGGLAYWPYGHAFNIKAFYTRVNPDAEGAHGWNQFNLQTQVYVF